MKTCSLNDFMNELKPWLDKEHIRAAELQEDGRLVVYFLDGMKNVYTIDDCNRDQIVAALAELKKKGIKTVH
jgi:cation transport ATPase